MQYFLFISHSSNDISSKTWKMAFLRNELPVFLPSPCLPTKYTIWLQSVWSIQMISGTSANGKAKNEWNTAEGQPIYTCNGCWRRQFRSFQEQSITGKADGLVLLRAETLPYMIRYNCTNPHKTVMTSKHFSRALPFLMMISLREHWVFTAKNVHSLLEWTWPPWHLVVFTSVLFSSALCFYRFQLFFSKIFLCSRDYKKRA